MTTPYDRQRQELNGASHRWAHRNKEPWTAAEDEVILDYWVLVSKPERDERGVSELVERTVEACRERARKIRRELDLSSPRSAPISSTTTTVTVTTTTIYRGWKESDGDGCDD